MQVSGDARSMVVSSLSYFAGATLELFPLECAYDVVAFFLKQFQLGKDPVIEDSDYRRALTSYKDKMQAFRRITGFANHVTELKSHHPFSAESVEESDVQVTGKKVRTYLQHFALDSTGRDLLEKSAREEFDKFHTTATLTVSDFKVFHLSNVENPLLAETKLLQGSCGAGKDDKRWFQLQEPSLEWQPFFEATELTLRAFNKTWHLEQIQKVAKVALNRGCLSTSHWCHQCQRIVTIDLFC